MFEIPERVSQIMTKDVIHWTPLTATARDASRLMAKKGKGCLVVINGGRPVGIVTERDIVRKVVAGGLDPSKTKVGEIMSSPLITIGPEAPARDAANLMVENGIRRLPVVEGHRLVGILTVTDFARHLRRTPGEMFLDAIARMGSLPEGVD